MKRIDEIKMWLNNCFQCIFLLSVLSTTIFKSSFDHAYLNIKRFFPFSALGVQTSPTEFSYQIPSWQQQQQTSQEYNNSESEMDELANTSGSAGQHHVKMKMSKMDSILVKNQKSVAKRRKRYLRRVVEKSGEPNIQYKNISKRRRKYFSDLYTTLVDSRYDYT